MERLIDWPERLIEFIEARRERAFFWGENDCALFCADAVRAITGTDIGGPWRGYKTKRGAVSRVRKAGGMRALALQAGLTQKHVGLGQRGDAVLAMMDGQETFGIVVGNGMWCAPGPQGLVFRPMTEAIEAFGV